MSWSVHPSGETPITWSVSRRLSIAFVLLLAIAIVIGGVSSWSAFAFINESRFTSRSNEVLKQIGLVLSTIQDAETGQRGFVLTGLDTYLIPYDTAIANLDQRIAQLDTLTITSTDQHERVNQLKPLIAQKMTELRTTVDLRRNTGFAAAQGVILTNHGEQVMSDIRTLIDVMQDQENSTLSEHTQQIRNSAQRTIWLFGSLMVFDVLLLVMIYFVVNRDILVRRQLNEELERRVGERTAQLDHVNQELHIEMAERKVAAEKQRQSEALLQAILDNAPIIVYVKDPQGNFTLINRQFENTFHMLKTQVIGKSSHGLSTISSHDGVEVYQMQDRRVLEANEIFSGEVVIPHNNGPRTYISLKFPLLDANGVAYAVGGMLTDISERKRAEEALRTSEQRYRTLIKNFPDGNVMLFDRDLRYTVADGTALHLAGLSSDQMVGRPAPEVLSSALQAVLMPGYRAALEGTSTSVESVVGHRTFVIDIVPVFDEHGEIQGGMSVSRDITERKRAEEALRLSEARLSGIINSAMDAIISVNTDQRIVVFNAAAKRMFRCTADEAIGHTIDRFIPERVRHAHAKHVNTFGSTQTTSRSMQSLQPLMALRSDGEEFPIEATISQVEIEGQRFFTVIIRDITERERAEEALRRSERRYRTLIENFPEGSVMLFDHDLRFIVADGGALAGAGFSKEQIEGRTIMEVLPSGSRALLEPAYRAALAGTTTHLELAGKQYTYDVHIVPIHDEQGAIQSGMVVSHDITKRKQAEEEVVRLNTELEQRVRERTAQLEAANKELEAFSYSVSHDLRSPLRSIDGFSLALLEDYGDQLDSMAHDYLDRVRSATNRMAQLIDDMLNLSRVTRSEMRVAPVDISALAEQVITDLQKAQPEREVEVVIAPDLVVNGDTQLLRVLLDNLLGNAWKFTRKRTDARIELGSTVCEGQQVYFVRDNGAGFDMTYATKLFGAFQRLHAMTEFEGTGVGLATVQRIVRRHGGRVWAESVVNEGATFFFAL